MSSAREVGLTAHSYYEQSVTERTRYPKLDSGVDCHVCVIGGGLAGLSAAIELRQRGFSTTVLEARRFGWGASGRNGGQVIAGLACDISVIERQLGHAAAQSVWQMSLEAIDLIHERRQQYGIECEWQTGFLSAAVKPRKARELRESVESMRARYGYEQRFIDGDEVQKWIASPRFVALAHDAKSGHLHPLRYTLGLAEAAKKEGAMLFEESAASDVRHESNSSHYVVSTASGSVRCRYVLFAGNVYLDRLAPQIRSRIMPVGTYVVASEPLDKARANTLIPSRSAICDTNFVLDYFRLSADDRVIFGGRVSYSAMTPPNLRESMRKRMLKVFPSLGDVKVSHSWGGFVDITMNRAPDFGRIPALGNDVYYLQGFSGHGVALTGIAGRIVAEAIAGTAERFDLFSQLQHSEFPGGRMLRMPALVAAMAWYRMRDML